MKGRFSVRSCSLGETPTETFHATIVSSPFIPVVVCRRTAALLVPSLPAMGRERNALINQRHPEFADIRAERPQPVRWDARLFGG